jgi:outer membrane biosynthesis protein TonB
MALDTPAEASSRAYSKYPGTAAIDAKGVFHKADEYPGKHPPWVDDQLKAVAATYPYADRAAWIEGVGRYRLLLDLQAGTVTDIRVIKSAGSKTLDYTAAKSASPMALETWKMEGNRDKRTIRHGTSSYASGCRATTALVTKLRILLGRSPRRA